MPVCKRCGVDKGEDAFYRSRGNVRTCKACENERRMERARQHPEQGQLQRRILKLKRYGLTVEDYDRMVAEQDGRCAICRHPGELDPSSPYRLGVDHDHGTGRVRGLLCRPCNRAVGILHDDPDAFDRAACYLRSAATATARIINVRTPDVAAAP